MQGCAVIYTLWHSKGESVRGLGQVEIRCRDHESFDHRCEICSFLRHAEQKLLSLRIGGDRMFSELKQRLAKRELIMIDLRF